MKSVVFSLTFHSGWGQNCFVVGDNTHLGNWKIEENLRMEYIDQNTWRKKIQMYNPEANVEYKYLFVDSDKKWIWEPIGKNRIIFTNPNENLQNDVWGIYEDRSIFQVQNGMSGMLRDCILLVCGIMKLCDDKVKAVIGMCVEHFMWKNHQNFMLARPHDVVISFHPDPEEMVKVINNNCVFEMLRTIFLNTVMYNGVYRLSLQNHYALPSSIFWVGVAPSNNLCELDPVDEILNGTCAFQFGVDDNEILSTLMIGSSDPIDIDVPVPDKSLIDVEVDTFHGTLVFFVNKKRVSHAFSNVSIPVNFGIKGHNNHSFLNVISFQRFLRATSELSLLIFHECEEI